MGSTEENPDQHGHPSDPARETTSSDGSEHAAGESDAAPTAGEATRELLGDVGRELNPANLAVDAAAGAAGLGAAKQAADAGEAAYDGQDGQQEGRRGRKGTRGGATGSERGSQGRSGVGATSAPGGGGAGTDTGQSETTSGTAERGRSGTSRGAAGSAADAGLAKAGAPGARDLLRSSQSDGTTTGDLAEVGRGAKTGAQLGSKVGGPVGTAVGGAAGGAVQAAKSKTGRRLLVAGLLFPPACALLVVFALMAMTMGVSSYKGTDERASTEATRTDGVSDEVVATLFESQETTTVPWEVLAALSRELEADGLGNEDPSDDQVAAAEKKAEDNKPVGPYRLKMDDARQMAKKRDVDVPPAGDLLSLEYAGEFVAGLLSARLSATSPGLSSHDVDTGAVLTETDGNQTSQTRRVLNTDDPEDKQAAKRTKQAYVDALAALPVEGMDESTATRVFTTARTWSLGESLACSTGTSTTTSGGAAPVGRGEWANPMKGTPSTSDAGDFGPRVHPITGESKLHDGWDVSAPTGTAIHAAGSGSVQVAEADPAWGTHVRVDHGGGIVTLYAHMQDGSLAVSEGDQVKAGTKLGEEGATGLATGPHLHFSVYKNGQAIDPKKYLAQRGARLGTGPVQSGSGSSQAGQGDGGGTGNPVLDAATAETSGSGGQGSASVPDSFTGTTTEGATVSLGREQLSNAAAIVDRGTRMRVPQKGLVVALMTALQESMLKNYANSNVPASLDHPHQAVGSDHDSVGLFQQRPASGWGPVAKLMDPSWSAAAFFGGPKGPNNGSPPGLLDQSGWQSMGLGEAAQAVQASAFPDAYTKWEQIARDLVSKVKGTSTPGTAAAGCPNGSGQQAGTKAVSARGNSGTSGGSGASGESGAAGTAIDFAMDQRGDAYVWGATGPDQWDCSSLVQAAWRKAGVELPRTTSDQSGSGQQVDRGEAKPGDLVFYYSPVSHVGIYLGDGKIVHAPRPGKTVQVVDWDTMPITTIRRVG